MDWIGLSCTDYVIVCCFALWFFQNLSSWKSRRQSQRKSDEQDDGLTTAVSTRVTTTSSQNRATEQLTNEIEDMVLSAFGFTRASQQQQQHQQPSAVVRSTDLVPAGRPTSNTQQSTAIQSAPDTSVSLSPSFPFPTFPPLQSRLSPYLPVPSLVEVGPLNPARGSAECT